MQRMLLPVCAAIVLAVSPTATGQDFVRGDANDDFATNLADSVFLASYLYSGGPPPVAALDAGDTNDNGSPEASDIVYILELFLGGPFPPAPFPFPGPDPTPNDFDPPVDPGIAFELPTLNVVPGEFGLAMPLLLTNDKDVEAVEVALTFDPVAIDFEEWDITNSLLGDVNAEFVDSDISAEEGTAWLAAIVDFATPIDGHAIPPGDDELLATLIVSVPVSAPAPQVTEVSFAASVGTPPKYNIASVNGGNAVTPLLTAGALEIELPFIRGDVNRDGMVDIGDAVYLLTYLFQSGPAPTCEDSADANNDGMIDLADGIYLLNYLFVGGPTPSEPFPDPGLDPDDDELGCEA